jgi:hypothetical protein
MPFYYRKNNLEIARSVSVILHPVYAACPCKLRFSSLTNIQGKEGEESVIALQMKLESYYTYVMV